MDELYPLSVLSARPNPALSGRDGGAAAMVVKYQVRESLKVCVK
jgi:hypothetical protein